MKLTTKFTLWYFGIMLVVLLIGGAIVYFEIQRKLTRVEVARHERLNDIIAEQIRRGGNYTEDATRKRATVTKIPADSVLKGGKSFYTRGSEWNPEFKTTEYRLQVTSYYNIGGEHYRVTTYSFIPSFYQLLPGVVDSFQWILLLLLVLVVISSGLISKYILAPFKRTMRVIQSFDLKQKEEIRLPATRTSEFRELNQFLRKMTEKAKEDYQTLKEFTENASHELQTPTAIIRGKLDLLMESDIRDEQAVLIAEMQNALERLSRIHSSLTLLTKLENKEYGRSESVNMSSLVKAALGSFEELIEMKSLHLKAEVGENVYVSLHPALADLLLMNLVSNAIRHNAAPADVGSGMDANGAEGWMMVRLTQEGLVVANSGLAPQVPVEELFERFKKGNPGGDSIGIGLAIVRQICDLGHFTIEYLFKDRVHMIAVGFTERVSASRLLQNLSVPLPS
ncbi:MAG TPA: HAMP domain-containing sensor histidine kinase [Puia sp.]|jgi:signal transduction histidine kinase|nr:HAMP domain-containing sensor histidine kinase [Puia sp.]